MPSLPTPLARAFSAALVAAVAAAPAALAQDPPFNVEEVGRFDQAENYADVWGAGDFAYLARTSDQVDIVDVGDPADPVLAATYDGGVFGSAQDVKVAGGLMFVGYESGSPGSQIVDVRDPRAPTLLTDVTVRSAIHNLFYDGGWLYLVDSATNQIDLIDLRGYDPDAAPPVISDETYRLTGVGTAFVHDITVRNGRLYAAAWNSLEVYDVSDLDGGPPVFLGSARGSNVHSSWPTEDGRYVVTAEEREGGGLTLFEITDNGDSISLDQLDTFNLPVDRTSSVHNPVILGDVIYTAWYEAGMIAAWIDRDAGQMVPIASFDTTARDGTDSFFGGCWGVYPLFGPDRVLANDRREGLFVLDVDLSLVPIRLAVSDVVPGQQVTLAASGAVPGETVSFALSGTGTGMGPCPPVLGGLCLDLLSPALAGSAEADLGGTAVLELTVPVGVPVDTAWFQAVIPRGGGGGESVKSDVVEKPVL